MKNCKKYLIVGSIFVVIVLTFISYLYIDKEEEIYIAEETIKEEILNEFYVDVKGAVKNPGVYKFINNDRVFDAIEKAGGLNKNGNTSNINLSKKLTSEMVVYIYTNTEIKKGSNSINCNTKCNYEIIEANNCYMNETRETKKININTASIDELLTLTGIGESKAKAIINYREENGGFKEVEELMKVTGIGQTLYNSIKEDITL